jgi:hypothetical protein
MTFDLFLGRVIDDGIAAAQRDYTDPQQAQLLAGSVAGFEACRGLSGLQLVRLYDDATRWSHVHYRDVDHWYWRGYISEVEWCCNCVSAVLINEGRPPLLAWLPTASGCLKAAEIVGVETVTA